MASVMRGACLQCIGSCGPVCLWVDHSVCTFCPLLPCPDTGLWLVTCFYFLATARWFLFGLILIITIGKVHFWIFPNLENEKCGFFESFKPFYSIEGPSETEKKRSKHKKRAEEKAELETEDTAETDDAQQSPSEDTQSEKTAETAA